MSDQTYNWKRFWCPREGSMNLSDRGYLFDPDSEFGQFFNNSCVPFESIEDIACLVLLGEPGIGKSTAMELQKTLIDCRVAEAGEASLWINLNAYQTDSKLCQEIFENPVFQTWQKGEHKLHLFLDSLDECWLHIKNVANILVKEFKKYPVKRPFLRIACRTADWPNSLEKGLRGLRGENSVGVYELTPLRRIDVIEAAKANGLNPEEFLPEIDRMNIVPFAIKPVTLQFLINIYKRSGQFPQGQAELYYQGCKILCEETSESRREARLTGTYNAEQRMAIAGRIAALTIFTGKYAIWTGVDLGDAPEEDVTITQLYGENEIAKGIPFEGDKQAVEETLATGLFLSREPYRLGWAHQTYAEFLAARYLVQHKLELTQMMSLIVHPGDPDGKIVPQLHKTAAWLATMVPDVFRKITQVDPELLLRSDVATADVKDKETLVANLLKLYDEEKLVDSDWEVRKYYSKLFHPGLVNQLKPYIVDAGKGFVVRRVAIDIAEACELKELQSELINIALDPAQQLSVRVNAARAIWKVGDKESKLRLKPLALGEAGDDPDDELKGYAIMTLWPDHMTTEELFAILNPPKRENFLGAYTVFLPREVIQHIKPSDLTVALNWVEKKQLESEILSTLGRLADEIILRAWDALDSSGVLEAFARVIFLRMKNYYRIMGEESKLKELTNMVRDDDDKRRKVLKLIVSMMHDPQKESFRLIHKTPFVLSIDVRWMIERLKESNLEKEQRAWAHLIERVFDVKERLQLEAIYLASQNYPVLEEVCSWCFKPVTLNSPEAERLRKNYQENKKRQEKRQNRPLLKPPPAERIAILLDKFESGELAAWWQLNRKMTLESDITHYGNELEPDLSKLPGWNSADKKTRERIVKAAKKYILEQDPKTSEWLGTNSLHRPAFAGYRALLLLMQEAPVFLNTIPADIWEKWAPIIIAYPISSGNEDEEPHQKIVSMAYRYAPEEITKTLMVMVDQENKEHDHIYITRKILGCWDKHIADALLAKARETELKPKCMGCLLGTLLEHEHEEAKEFTQSLVTLPLPKIENTRRRAVVAATVLLCHAKNAGWPVVWPAIQQDLEFGKEVVFEVAQVDRHSASIGQKLSEEQLADLFIWLTRQFPYSEDPVHDETHWVGPRENVAEWRNSILNQLKKRGTQETCNAIRGIVQELPELAWLKWTLLEAKVIARRHTWLPYKPEEILKIVTNRQLRLVNSGEQLLDVLVESLKRYEAKLQGETPSAIDLWNENPHGPKDEGRFSDHIERHLKEDLCPRGIIVNREVQIRRGVGAGTGERTDIHVDAVTQSQGETYDSVTVIIEVKGCWNDELNQAMETQLVNRYLKDNRCQYGLYLIGWFNCKQWDDKDNRKGRAPKISLDKAKECFDAQARKLSLTDRKIRALVLNATLR